MEVLTQLSRVGAASGDNVDVPLVDCSVVAEVKAGSTVIDAINS